MKIDIQSKNYNLSERLKDLIEKKVGKLERFFDKPVEAKVVCTKNKDRQKMEINVYSGGLYIRSEVETDNMYANLDVALAKIEKQIIKYVDKKLTNKKKQAKDMLEFDFFDEVPEVKLPKITKRKVFDLVPMTEKEALMQMDMLGNDFFVFMNSKINRICLLYKRADGDIGMIETK